MKRFTLGRTLCLTMVTAVSAAALAVSISAAAPLLPSWEYFADPEPHVFWSESDQEYRVYIYGSHDLGDVYGGGCLGEYMAWSAPADDLEDWRCDGVLYAFHDEDPELASPSSNILASDCTYKVDEETGEGWYYLYYGGGVARSKNPGGPFQYYGEVKYDAALYPEKVDPETGEVAEIEQQFDPSILVDDDGRNYLYTGGTSQVVELADDMLTIIDGPYRIVPRADEIESAKTNPELFPGMKDPASVEGHAFYEGSSIKKFNGIYYLLWCNENHSEYSYAMSDNPMEGFEYKGVLLSNAGKMEDSDRVTYPVGNIHGGLAEIDGQYYIFYHRQTNATGTRWWSNRQAMVERIEMNADGTFVRAEMTSQGAGGHLNPFTQYSADIACYLTPDILSLTDEEYDYWDYESANGNGPYIKELDADTHVITNTTHKSIAGFKYYDFGDRQDREMTLTLNLRSKAAAGTIDVYVEDELVKFDPATATKIGSYSMTNQESIAWHDVTIPVDNVTGVKAVYLVFSLEEGEGSTATLCDLRTLQFQALGDSVVSLEGNSNVQQNTAADYTVNIGNVEQLMTVTAELAFDGDSFTAAQNCVTGLNGFTVLGGVDWISDHAFRVTLINNDGFSAQEAVALLNLQLTTSAAAESGTVTLNSLTLSGKDANGQPAYINYYIAEGKDSVTSYFYTSLYDVNRDGVVDQLDLTTAQLSYCAEKGEPEWDEAASHADVNGDGRVGIDDLILILSNINW